MNLDTDGNYKTAHFRGKKKTFLVPGLWKFPTLYEFGTPEILNLGGVPFKLNRWCIIKTINELF
jgi:hypothetical protein